MSPRRGPDLPYKIVTGVTPWRSKWLAASAKLAGATFAPENPRLFDSFAEVLSESPSFAIIIVNAPIGYPDGPDIEPRTCDQEARSLLGRRGSTIHSSPTREVLTDTNDTTPHKLDAISAKLLPRYKEVAAEMSPYRQRVVYEGHPELSFYQLNGDKPLRYSKNTEAGIIERTILLEKRIPEIAKIIDAHLEKVPQKHLLDAASLLWTARRVFGHAATRIPTDAEWDSEGMRIEMVF